MKQGDFLIFRTCNQALPRRKFIISIPLTGSLKIFPCFFYFFIFNGIYAIYLKHKVAPSYNILQIFLNQ